MQKGHHAVRFGIFHDGNGELGLISEKYKMIFVHIPKCGGSSVESVYWTDSERTEENLWMGFVDKYHNRYQTGGLQHLKALQIRQIIGRQRFADFFKFALVRNPYTKAVSQFRYMQRRPDLMDFIGMTADDGFVTYLHKIQTRSHVQWEQQVSFLFDYAGNCLVDYVGKLEEIEVAFKHVARQVGLPSGTALPHLNQSVEQAGSRGVYCAESRQIVEDIYKEDIEAFDYSFPWDGDGTDRPAHF